MHNAGKKLSVRDNFHQLTCHNQIKAFIFFIQQLSDAHHSLNLIVEHPLSR